MQTYALAAKKTGTADGGGPGRCGARSHMKSGVTCLIQKKKTANPRAGDQGNLFRHRTKSVGTRLIVKPY